MHALRCLASAAAALLVAGPALASTTEHEPARGALVLGLVFVAGLSWVMACRRWWLPLVVWPPLALAASAFAAHLIDPGIVAAIRAEIGADYVIEADLFVALAVTMPLMFAHMRMSRLQANADPRDARR